MIIGDTILGRNVLEGFPNFPNSTELRTKERMGIKKARREEKESMAYAKAL